MKYEKMSLFDAPESSIIVHACNAQGVWGRGIAKEFKDRYPTALIAYANHCKQTKNPLGTHYLRPNRPNNCNEKHRIGCLITSDGYAKNTDPEYKILVNTTLAIQGLLNEVHPAEHIYSNKFNSGLFGVPWEKTEYIINKILEDYPHIKWIVCDPNLTEQE